MSDTCIKHIEDYWKFITNKSNELFNKGNFEEALSNYKQALYRAEVLCNNIPNCIKSAIPFMQIYIISCNNVAYTYEKLGKYDKAEHMLKKVISYLIFMLNKEELIKPVIVQSELKRASLAYIQFLEENKNGEHKKEQLFYTLVQKLKEKEFQIYN
ncbi:tetratricopeptide repeat protein [Weeksellaceae bacterium TAE3-ERU29]|nr:tetratricopeptide repeat protein [Weeksellaceae bacterium TAE3-ERU29]